MIINDFHIFSFVGNPLKTNTPLVIDTDAILPRTIAFKFFELVARYNLDIL